MVEPTKRFALERVESASTDLRVAIESADQLRQAIAEMGDPLPISDRQELAHRISRLAATIGDARATLITVAERLARP